MMQTDIFKVMADEYLKGVTEPEVTKPTPQGLGARSSLSMKNPEADANTIEPIKMGSAVDTVAKYYNKIIAEQIKDNRGNVSTEKGVEYTPVSYSLALDGAQDLAAAGYDFDKVLRDSAKSGKLSSASPPRNVKSDILSKIEYELSTEIAASQKRTKLDPYIDVTNRVQDSEGNIVRDKKSKQYNDEYYLDTGILLEEGSEPIGSLTRKERARQAIIDAKEKVKSAEDEYFLETSEIYDPEEFKLGDAPESRATEFKPGDVPESIATEFKSKDVPEEKEGEGSINTDLGFMSRPATPDYLASSDSTLEANIKEVQSLLGFTGREVDGNFGKNSKKELKAFQKRAGLPETDNFTYDPATVEALKKANANIETATQGFLDKVAEGEGAKAGDETDYEIVYGYGKYLKPEIDGISTSPTGSPNRPLKITEMTFAQLYNYQNKMITATTGKIPAGKDKDGNKVFLKDKNGAYVGTSALGKYQVVRDSLFGKNGTPENPKANSWAGILKLDENTVFTPEIQERIGRLALKQSGFDNWLYNRNGGKSESNMLNDVAGIWASVEGNSYGQGTHTFKKDLEPYLSVLRERGVPFTSLRPRARPAGLGS